MASHSQPFLLTVEQEEWVVCGNGIVSFRTLITVYLSQYNLIALEGYNTQSKATGDSQAAARFLYQTSTTPLIFK